jgi:uncharacterized protein (TIGR02391 family)
MAPLNDFVPDVDLLLQMEPGELAGVVLAQLNMLGRHEQDQMLNSYNYTLAHATSHFHGYPPEHYVEISHRLAEAWGWLEAHGMVARRPNQSTTTQYFLTRRGRELRGREGVARYREGLELRRERLHPAIADRCHAQFLRGELDTAVFEAYKTLEIAIREASGLGVGHVGVRLARAAFHPTEGPLADPDQDAGERQALCDLMAGALGSYKNPHSHKRVVLTSKEAAEMILLASHLLGIIDARRPRRRRRAAKKGAA